MRYFPQKRIVKRISKTNSSLGLLMTGFFPRKVLFFLIIGMLDVQHHENGIFEDFRSYSQRSQFSAKFENLRELDQ